MSIENPAPSPVYIDNSAAPIHPAMVDSKGSVTNAGPHNQGSIHAANGPETSYAIGSVEHAAAVLAAAGNVEIVR
jgi:hypothetical protein